MINLMRTTIAILFFALLLQGCLSFAPPKPMDSEYFSTMGGSFLLDGSFVKYGMNYRLRKDLSYPLYIRVEFENPEPGGDVLSSDVKMAPGQKDLLVESPVLPGIEDNRVYLTVLRAYRDQAKTELVTEHAQEILFRMPEEILRQRGIVVY